MDSFPSAPSLALEDPDSIDLDALDVTEVVLVILDLVYNLLYLE